MINFALIEDNKKILNNLSHMLDCIFLKHNLDAEISLSTTNVSELLSFIEKNKIDVLFLDIDLNSNFSGLEIA